MSPGQVAEMELWLESGISGLHVQCPFKAIGPSLFSTEEKIRFLEHYRSSTNQHNSVMAEGQEVFFGTGQKQL